MQKKTGAILRIYSCIDISTSRDEAESAPRKKTRCERFLAEMEAGCALEFALLRAALGLLPSRVPNGKRGRSANFIEAYSRDVFFSAVVWPWPMRHARVKPIVEHSLLRTDIYEEVGSMHGTEMRQTKKGNEWPLL